MTKEYQEASNELLKVPYLYTILGGFNAAGIWLTRDYSNKELIPSLVSLLLATLARVLFSPLPKTKRKKDKGTRCFAQLKRAWGGFIYRYLYMYSLVLERVCKTGFSHSVDYSSDESRVMLHQGPVPLFLTISSSVSAGEDGANHSEKHHLEMASRYSRAYLLFQRLQPLLANQPLPSSYCLHSACPNRSGGFCWLCESNCSSSIL